MRQSENHVPPKVVPIGSDQQTCRNCGQVEAEHNGGGFIGQCFYDSYETFEAGPTYEKIEELLGDARRVLASFAELPCASEDDDRAISGHYITDGEIRRARLVVDRIDRSLRVKP